MARRVRPWIVFVAMIATSACACGLVFAPGDYESGPTANVASIDATSETGASSGGEASVVDGGGGGAGTHLMVIAGRRDPFAGESTTQAYFVLETMRATVLPSGDLSPWTFDLAPPAGASWTRLEVSADSLLLQQGNSVAKVAFNATSDHLSGDWQVLALRGSTPENGQRGWLFDKGLVSAGGFAPQATQNVYVAPFNFGDAGIDPWQPVATSKLVAARADVTLLLRGNRKHLYAIGGRTSTSVNATGKDDVEVAAMSADGVPGTFEATTKLATTTSGMTAHGVIAPMVAEGAGHVFVLGGSVTANGSLTDVALASKIVDDATGKLGPWTTLPKLPMTMTSGAAVVLNDRVYVIGGIGVPNATDAVLALGINKDGTFGTEWKRVGSLPGARRDLVALVY